MKRFRCGDVIPGCDAAYYGSEEQILFQAGAHAANAHGLSFTEAPVDLVTQVRGAMVAA